VLLGDVSDQLLDDDRLADAGAAEDADLATLGERADEVDDFDPGLEDLRLRRLLVERRGRAMDRQTLGDCHRALLVDRLSQDVEDASEGDLTDRDGDRAAGVEHLDPAGQTVGGRHGHGADPVVAEVLLHFADDLDSVAAHDLDGVEDPRQLAGRELDVDDRAGDLDHTADGRAGSSLGGCRHRCVGASWFRRLAA
jgi:hypothetical protein